MKTLNTLDYQQGRQRPNKVMERLKAVFQQKNNPATLITADYDSKLVRNTLATKFTQYMNGKEFGTLEFHDKEGNDIIMEQEYETLHIKVDNKQVKDFNLNEVWVIKRLIEAV